MIDPEYLKTPYFIDSARDNRSLGFLIYKVFATFSAFFDLFASISVCLCVYLFFFKLHIGVAYVQHYWFATELIKKPVYIYIRSKKLWIIILEKEILIQALYHSFPSGSLPPLKWIYRTNSKGPRFKTHPSRIRVYPFPVEPIIHFNLAQ